VLDAAVLSPEKHAPETCQEYLDALFGAREAASLLPRAPDGGDCAPSCQQIWKLYRGAAEPVFLDESLPQLRGDGLALTELADPEIEPHACR
jgi:hypothetical protein